MLQWFILEFKPLQSIMIHSLERITVPVSLGSVSHLTLVNKITIMLRRDSASLFLNQCSNCSDKSLLLRNNFYLCDRFSGLSQTESIRIWQCFHKCKILWWKWSTVQRSFFSCPRTHTYIQTNKITLTLYLIHIKTANYTKVIHWQTIKNLLFS